MLLSTSLARARAAGRLMCGAYLVGALNRPASIADSASVRSLAGLAEIVIRRRHDAEGAAAHIGAVEIELEDLVLGQVELEPERQEGFLDLALERALVRQEEVLGQLLRDRGAALHDAAAAGVDGQGAEGADRVDAPMLVEAPVLGRERRLDEVVREILELVGIVVADAAAADLLAVAVEEGDGEVLRLQPVVARSRGRPGWRAPASRRRRPSRGSSPRWSGRGGRGAGRESADVSRRRNNLPQASREAAAALEQGRVQPGVEAKRRALDPRR